jgi:hypothetical protein
MGARQSGAREIRTEGISRASRGSMSRSSQGLRVATDPPPSARASSSLLNPPPRRSDARPIQTTGNEWLNREIRRRTRRGRPLPRPRHDHPTRRRLLADQHDECAGRRYLELEVPTRSQAVTHHTRQEMTHELTVQAITARTTTTKAQTPDATSPDTLVDPPRGRSLLTGSAESRTFIVVTCAPRAGPQAALTHRRGPLRDRDRAGYRCHAESWTRGTGLRESVDGPDWLARCCCSARSFRWGPWESPR